MNKINIKKIIPTLTMSTECIDENTQDFSVTVVIDNKKFSVICQIDDYDCELSCFNQSGGDFVDSGLQDFISKNYEINKDDDDDDEIGEIGHALALLICKEAQNHAIENSVEAYIKQNYNLDVEFSDSAYSVMLNNVSIDSYKAINSDEVVAVALDNSVELVARSIISVRVFDDANSYEDWRCAQYVNEDGHDYSNGDVAVITNALSNM